MCLLRLCPCPTRGTVLWGRMTMTQKLSTAVALVLALSSSMAIAQDASTNSGVSGSTSTQTSTGTNAGATTEVQGTTGAGATDQSGAAGGADATGGTGTTTTTETTTTDGPSTTGTTGTSVQTDVDAGTSTSVELSSEQQTEIRTVITEVNVAPVVAADLDFDLSVGVAVPQTVVLEPLPVRIVEIVPQYQGFLFFRLDDGRIVIVDPDSLQIVLIINS
ncbi:Protein of unknown function [Devosia crocina]|uniref:DUF1236 domain-containing protein n=2 Tax=Devosia crocina TaxID=429728 RepID=A0A1I7N288_9HYPH|nr:Protein of unknown function [Devosia crocina]